MFSDNLNQLKKNCIFSEDFFQVKVPRGGVCWGSACRSLRKSPLFNKKKYLKKCRFFYQTDSNDLPSESGQIFLVSQKMYNVLKRMQKNFRFLWTFSLNKIFQQKQNANQLYPITSWFDDSIQKHEWSRDGDQAGMWGVRAPKTWGVSVNIAPLAKKK